MEIRDKGHALLGALGFGGKRGKGGEKAVRDTDCFVRTLVWVRMGYRFIASKHTYGRWGAAVQEYQNISVKEDVPQEAGRISDRAK